MIGNETFVLDDDGEMDDKQQGAARSNESNEPEIVEHMDLDDDVSEADSPMQSVAPSAEDEAARKRQMIGKIGAIVAGALGLGVMGVIGYTHFIAPATAPDPVASQSHAEMIAAPVATPEPVPAVPDAQAQAITQALLDQQQTNAAVPDSGGFQQGDAPATPIADSLAPQGAGMAPVAGQGEGAAGPVAAVAACEDTQPLQSEIAELKQKLAESERTAATMLQAAKQKPAASVQHASKGAGTQARSAANRDRVLSEYTVRVAREGQAWIDVGNRQVAVVQVGDRLPNGAKVLAIAAESGRVNTSMGSIHP